MVTKNDLDAIAKGMAPVMKSYVRDRVDMMAEALGRALARSRAEIREEFHGELNLIRERLDMPIIKAERLRYRVPAGRGATW